MNFTDEVPVFMPYVSQQPIDQMAKVGMMRENAYQEGIQTVQSIFDNALAMPIAKPEVREYVKQKVGQLNKAVSQSISGDFSDRRLINQIGGLASQISSDPIVQEGVQSTARIQSGLARSKADQERAMKDGKNPTNNINDFNDQINAYLSDGAHNTSFKGDYTPYVDVIDRAVKLFKEQNPGQTIDADAFYYDKNDLNPDGSSKLKPNPAYFKGVDPSRIQAVLNMVYSQPDVQAQLGVDGRQTFKGMDSFKMADYITKSTNERIGQLESTIRDLQLEGTTNGTADKQQINSQIDFYQKQYDELVKEHDSNNKILLGENPEALKSKLVWENTKYNFLKAYSYKDPQGNPFFDKWLEVEKFNETKRMNQHTMAKDKEDYEFKLRESIRKGLPKPEDSIIAGVSTMGVNEQQAIFTPGDAQAEIEQASDVHTQTRRKLAATIASGANEIPPFIEDSRGRWVPNIAKYKANNPSISPEEAERMSQQDAQTILNKANENYNKGVMTNPEQIKLYQESQKTWDNLQNKEARVNSIESTFKPELDVIRKEIGSPDFASAYIVRNKAGNWEKEQATLIQKYGENWEEKMGLGSDKTVKRGEDVQLVHTTGANEKAYADAARKIKSRPEFIDITQRYNQAYREASTTTASKVVTLKVEGEKYDISRTQLNTMIEPLLSVPGGATSEAEAFMSAQKAGKFTAMHVYYNADGKEGVIVGEVGKKQFKVRVPKETLFQQFPQLQPNGWFEDNFRSKLDYARTTSTPNTTDVGAKGRTGSYLIQSNDLDYIVQYHVDIKNGQYNIRYWVTPKSNPTGPSIINGQSYFDEPSSEASVEQAVKQDLSNPQIVALLVKQATQKK